MSDLFKRGFFVREPAWHKQGVVLDDYPGRERAMEIAGHRHEVAELPVFTNPFAPRTVEGYKLLVRTDNGETIAVMPESYQVIQNEVPWDLADSIVTADRVRYETAGILGGRFDEEEGWQLRRGSVYWVLAHLDRPSFIPGDDSPVYPFILATWSHDGSQALRVKETDVRVVCANTQALALGRGGKDFVDVSIRHTRNAGERVEEVRDLLTYVERRHDAFVEAATDLAGMEVRDEGLGVFVETILPLPVDPDGYVVSDRVARNVEEAREAVWAILNGETGTVRAGIRNTAYGLYQAGVEYFDHVRPWRTPESYFQRNLMRTERTKARLDETVRDVAAEYAVR